MAKIISEQIKFLIRKLLLQIYKLEYHIEAHIGYFFHLLAGGSTEKRIKAIHGPYHPKINSTKIDKGRLALFAAFHINEGIPISNVNYLKSLRASGFRIIYIHNGVLGEAAIESLSSYCEQILCRSNIGQDFGAWKDGYLYCRSNNIFKGIEWLLLCNDSNIFLGGKHASIFEDLFNKALSQKSCELIALNKNFEYWQHFQSYFLCFHSRLFTQDKFDKFWANYAPINNRYHAIRNGEVALTQTVIQASRSTILFDSFKLYKSILNNASSKGDILQYLPQNALRSLAPQGHQTDQSLDIIYLHQILAYLDSHNPSHAHALLWVRFLKSPFLKKDLFRQGVFTLAQIRSLLDAENIESSEFLDEIQNIYTSSGSNLSFLKYPRKAYRKGIPSPASKMFNGHAYATNTNSKLN